MKSIDGALELGVPKEGRGFCGILAIPSRAKEGGFILGGESGANVGRDAVLVNEFAAWGEILRGGEPSGGTVGKGDDALHRAFAEGGFADDEGAVEVLERAGDDLRTAGAGVVG